MEQLLSFIGPDDVFMDDKGKLYKKASDDRFIPIQNKYTEAEDRYIQNKMDQKGR